MDVLHFYKAVMCKLSITITLFFLLCSPSTTIHLQMVLKESPIQRKMKVTSWM